jgi:hypothetical protein
MYYFRFHLGYKWSGNLFSEELKKYIAFICSKVTLFVIKIKKLYCTSCALAVSLDSFGMLYFQL